MPGEEGKRAALTLVLYLSHRALATHSQEAPAQAGRLGIDAVTERLKEVLFHLWIDDYLVCAPMLQA